MWWENLQGKGDRMNKKLTRIDENLKILKLIFALGVFLIFLGVVMKIPPMRWLGGVLLVVSFLVVPAIPIFLFEWCLYLKFEEMMK
jgi:hypothetical protein